MHIMEDRRNKIIEEYIFITQGVFLLLTGILLVRSSPNISDSYIYFYRNIIFLLLPFAVIILHMINVKKTGKTSAVYLDIVVNTVYFLFVVFFLVKERDNFFKFLLLMPVIVSALRQGLKYVFIWAFLDTVCLIGIDVTFDPDKMDVDVLAIAFIWLFAWLFGRIAEMELNIWRELQKLASQDGLTKMFNHRSFYCYLEEYVKEYEQKKDSFVLIMLDVDSFKYYNDAYGHQKGDDVLQLLAGVIISVIGDRGKCFRYGGDEFAILIPKCEGIEGLEIGEKIRREVEKANVDGVKILPGGKLTIAVGVACFPEHTSSIKMLVQMADEALYKAKYTNNNRAELYHSVFGELDQSFFNNKKDLTNSLRTLLMIVNAKDRYTYGHSERVMNYAVQIGEKLNLLQGEIQDLTVGGLLHDIGKIEISRDILNKTERLSDGEWRIIKKHGIWGADIVRSISKLNKAVDIVLYHHENFDGTGYPTSLKENDIPLGARILRVADSFDAMTTNRPYKRSMTFKEALDELERYKGIYYDAKVVDLFREYINESCALVETEKHK
ncbi:MAG: diguanylate cyclase [Clostridia bacterium]|nr:diguanylate cyclase [Clostridia bacterium]MDD4049270.1 diguanylate cyclase [Clostridia bacterium]